MRKNARTALHAAADGRAECEDEILRSLRRVIRAVDLYSRRLTAEYGLSGPQLQCLRQLDSQGPLPTGALAEAMSLSPATVCGILDRLEARGLVVRERQTHDKRRVVVRLSVEGETVTERAPPSLQESFLTRLRALSSAEQSELQVSLEKLVAMMAAAELDAAPLLTSEEALGVEAPRPHGEHERNE